MGPHRQRRWRPRRGEGRRPESACQHFCDFDSRLVASTPKGPPNGSAWRVAAGHGADPPGRTSSPARRAPTWPQRQFHQAKAPAGGGFCLVEVVGVEPTSKTCRLAVHPQAWSALETSWRGTDEPLRTCAPLSRPLSGGVAAAYLVPPSGRPKPPFRRFNELGTQRSRGLARSLGCPRQREPVRSYRWQFDVGGLMRGPAVQPPPAPDTRITTCRNRSPPWV